MEITTVEELDFEPVDVPAPRVRLAVRFAAATTVAAALALSAVLLTLGITPGYASAVLSFGAGDELRAGTEVAIASTLDESVLWFENTPPAVIGAPGQVINWYQRYESVTGTCATYYLIYALPAHAFHTGSDEASTYSYLGIASTDTPSSFGMTFQDGRAVETVSFVTDSGRTDYRAFSSDQTVVVVNVSCKNDGDEAHALTNDVLLRTTLVSTN